MKQTKKLSLILLLCMLLAALLIITACGSNKKQKTPTTSAITTPIITSATTSAVGSTQLGTDHTPSDSEPALTTPNTSSPTQTTSAIVPNITTAPLTTSKAPTTSNVCTTQTVTTQAPNEPTLPTDGITLFDITDENGLLWYQFEEGEGASVLYSSLSQERDSILFYGTLAKAGGIDNSGYAQFSEGDGIKLNNTFTDWGQITDTTFLHPATQAISVAFYMMPDSIDGTQLLFEYGSRYRGFAIGIENGALSASITAANTSDGDGTRIELDTAPLTEDATKAWTHVFFTYDGTLDGGTATLYLNFKKVAEQSGVGSYLPKVLDASGVATSEHGSNSLLWEGAYYSGKMDDLRIYKTGFTQVPALEDGVIYLQSAAKKNHYLKATASTVTCLSMVEPAFRGIIFEKGLADENGISFRMSGTKNYLMAKNDTIVAATLTSENDKKAATFYSEDALAIPSWGESEKALFKSYRTQSGEYLTAKDGAITLTKPTDEAGKLSATFKTTGDQTKVIDNLRGVVYYPSYALNAPQFWKWYDSAIIERDMQYAKALNFDAFRIWVSYEYWLEDPAHFENSYNNFLTLADQYGIKVMTSLFEGCGKAEEGYDSENVWSRDYTKAWSITSPSKAIYENASRWNEPKAFVTWFFKTYGNDQRHMAIEIYNEPWGNREGCAKFLSEYAITVQGSVPITFGTAPAGSYNIVYSADKGADMLHYHDNFPSSTDAFYNNARNRIEQGRLANLPVYCTEVQWVGGPSGINYPMYQNLAPTVEKLMETDVWAPFYWTLMVHPCYLDSYRNNFKMKNGIIQEDGSFYSIENAQAIAPEVDLEGAVENSHNPFDDKFYTYQYTFSDDFADKHAYKWTKANGTWSAESTTLIGNGRILANDTAFADFTATFTVTPEQDASFVFRYQDENHYYLATVEKGSLTLYKVASGEKTSLSTSSVEYTGGTLNVTVMANGASLRLSANCTDCTATDTTFTSGKIGFEATQSAAFDALLVNDIAQ